MSDVIQLILQDHEALRGMFTQVQRLREDPVRAAVVWAELSGLLEAHAVAEEEHFYPALLRCVPGSEDETRDAIRDHDEIRDGIRRALDAEIGSAPWWAAIEQTRDANDEHLAEEERDDLPDCLRHVTWERRAELGERFEEVKGRHRRGRGLRLGDKDLGDKDPDRYVDEHRVS